MATSQSVQQKPAKVIRTEIVRVIMPARPPCAVARDVRPEQERDADAAPGRGRYADCY
jgi:hypothetical protein